jgi:hypothetical protein
MQWGINFHDLPSQRISRYILLFSDLRYITLWKEADFDIPDLIAATDEDAKPHLGPRIVMVQQR